MVLRLTVCIHYNDADTGRKLLIPSRDEAQATVAAFKAEVLRRLPPGSVPASTEVVLHDLRTADSGSLFDEDALVDVVGNGDTLVAFPSHFVGRRHGAAACRRPHHHHQQQRLHHVRLPG